MLDRIRGQCETHFEAHQHDCSEFAEADWPAPTIGTERGEHMNLSRFGLTILLGLGGCSIPQRYQLTAAPVETVTDAIIALNSDASKIEGPQSPSNQQNSQVPLIHAPKAGNYAIVQHIAHDLEIKCDAFVNSLFASTAGTRFVLDVLTTTSTALGAVFTPLATAHAFSAAGAITSGTNSSISADYLNNLTLSHFVQAIQTSYGTGMQTYLQALDANTQQDSIDPYAAQNKIVQIHSTCSLASANGTISSTLATSAPSEQAQSTLTYTTKQGDTAVTVASGLLALIKKDPTFQALRITASEQGAKPNGTLVLSVPGPTNVTKADLKDGVVTIKVTPGALTTVTVSANGTIPVGDTVSITATRPAELGANSPPTSGGNSTSEPPSGSAAPAPIAGAALTAKTP